MNLITELLLEAVQGESTAEKQYLHFGSRAKADGLSGVAALFIGLSHAESIHIANHKRALEKNGYSGNYPGVDFQGATSPSTLENLCAAIEGEKDEFTRMYPLFMKKIRKRYGSQFTAKIALLSMKWAMDSEKHHHDLLVEAKVAVDRGGDTNSAAYYLCAVCGNLHYSSTYPTELCPVCGHDLSFYSKVELSI